MQAVGGDADLAAEAELTAVGELGGGVDQDDGAVDLGGETLGRLGVGGDDSLGVARAVAGDVVSHLRSVKRCACLDVVHSPPFLVIRKIVDSLLRISHDETQSVFGLGNILEIAIQHPRDRCHASGE